MHLAAAALTGEPLQARLTERKRRKLAGQIKLTLLFSILTCQLAPRHQANFVGLRRLVCREGAAQANHCSVVGQVQVTD